jgi:uncharacterized membrane protein (DUF106 family)
MKRILSVIHSEIDDLKENGLIFYFFDDMEEYEAYKPYLKLLVTGVLLNVIITLLCL